MSIFVSHSEQDDALYTNFCLTLDQAKIRRWDPKRMAIGESLADQLRKAIRACDACVFLATKRSIASQWCMAELGASAPGLLHPYSRLPSLRACRRAAIPRARTCALNIAGRAA